MKEIEVKILEVDAAAIVSKLQEFGAERTFKGELEVLFYDYEDQYFKRHKKRLRLRRGGDIVELTVKHKVSQERTMIAEEFQVNVSDFDMMRTILEEMNMVVVRSYTKHRQTWCLREAGVVVTIDTLLDGIPPYMEIEAQNEKDVFAWVERFGFRKKDAKAWSGGDVLRHYGIEPVDYKVEK